MSEDIDYYVKNKAIGRRPNEIEWWISELKDDKPTYRQFFINFKYGNTTKAKLFVQERLGADITLVGEISLIRLHHGTDTLYVNLVNNEIKTYRFFLKQVQDGEFETRSLNVINDLWTENFNFAVGMGRDVRKIEYNFIERMNNPENVEWRISEINGGTLRGRSFYIILHYPSSQTLPTAELQEAEIFSEDAKHVGYILFETINSRSGAVSVQLSNQTSQKFNFRPTSVSHQNVLKDLDGLYNEYKQGKGKIYKKEIESASKKPKYNCYIADFSRLLQ